MSLLLLMSCWPRLTTPMYPRFSGTTFPISTSSASVPCGRRRNGADEGDGAAGVAGDLWVSHHNLTPLRKSAVSSNLLQSKILSKAERPGAAVRHRLSTDNGSGFFLRPGDPAGTHPRGVGTHPRGVGDSPPPSPPRGGDLGDPGKWGQKKFQSRAGPTHPPPLPGGSPILKRRVQRIPSPARADHGAAGLPSSTARRPLHCRPLLKGGCDGARGGGGGGRNLVHEVQLGQDAQRAVAVGVHLPGDLDRVRVRQVTRRGPAHSETPPPPTHAVRKALAAQSGGHTLTGRIEWGIIIRRGAPGPGWRR